MKLLRSQNCRADWEKNQKGKKMLSQIEKILNFVEQRGSISSLEATNELKIMSFTKRMSEIRRNPNYEVTQKWESNGHTRWLRYEIKEVEHDKAN